MCWAWCSASVTHAQLRVSQTGTYTLDEQVVPAARQAQVKLDFTHDLSAAAEARLQAEAASGPAR